MDAGRSRDGRPYLVMEYVAGEPLNAYCRRAAPDLRIRIGLFLEICGAVSYAHHNLVVHRDLKPANILVTAGGRPKLLDFGLARLVDPDAQATRSMAWMTPEYASPEQVRGEPVTVASDVYSLGVILYEMLVEKRPYEVDTSSPLNAVRTICDTEPPLASNAVESQRRRRELRGDLDNIAARALEKDPQRRYESVEQLAADLRGYLDGRPVLARPQSAAYRFGKFLRRNRTTAALTASIVLASLIGAGVSIWEARKARRAFDEVRGIADTMLFDVSDAIHSLPGSVPAREMLARRALEYLARLSQDAGSSEMVQKDLAEGYSRIAQIQGGVGISSLGQWEEARENYRKTIGFYATLVARHSENYAYRSGLARAYGELSLITEDRVERLDLLRRQAEVLESAPKRYNSIERAASLGLSHFAQSRALSDVGDYNGALSELTRSLDYYKQAEQAGGNFNSTIAAQHRRMGATLAALGRISEGLQHYDAARQIDVKRVQAHPENLEAKLDLSYDLSDPGGYAHDRDDHRTALAIYKQVTELRRAVAAADLNNERAAVALASSLCKLGRELYETGDFAGAELTLREAIADTEALPSRDSSDRILLATSQRYMGALFLARRSHARACEWFRVAQKTVAETRAKHVLTTNDEHAAADIQDDAQKNCSGR
jgi:tetratricopeptide (TPR) repeat protein